jgi:hypothetical protein
VLMFLFNILSHHRCDIPKKFIQGFRFLTHRGGRIAETQKSVDASEGFP